MNGIDPDALLTASQGAAFAGVSLAAFCNWVTRGYRNPATGEHEHLRPAADSRGRTIKDGRGRPQYRLLAVARAEAATSVAACRAA